MIYILYPGIPRYRLYSFSRASTQKIQTKKRSFFETHSLKSFQ